MNSYNDWLSLRINDYEWIPFSKYMWNMDGKHIRLDNKEGYIIEKQDNQYVVYIDDDYCCMDLEHMDCLIEKGPIRNSDFCIKNGLIILKYLKTCKEFNVILSDKDFLFRFATIIYKYSKL